MDTNINVITPHLIQCLKNLFTMVTRETIPIAAHSLFGSGLVTKCLVAMATIKLLVTNNMLAWQQRSYDNEDASMKPIKCSMIDN